MKRTEHSSVFSTILTAGAGLLVVSLLASCASSTPTEQSSLDPATRVLALCPDSPNCVSTRDTDDEHGIDAISFSGTSANAIERMVAVIGAMPRAKLITQSEDYLHFEFRSRIFRFVDDVEFVFDEEAGQIAFRSASRVGYSDMGVNRKRMEEIRGRFEASE